MNITPYYVKVAPSAQRALRAHVSKHLKLIIKYIEALAVNPRPPGYRKIGGMTGLYSVEVEDVRLIYKVEDQEVLILLVK